MILPPPFNMEIYQALTSSLTSRGLVPMLKDRYAILAIFKTYLFSLSIFELEIVLIMVAASACRRQTTMQDKSGSSRKIASRTDRLWCQ